MLFKKIAFVVLGVAIAGIVYSGLDRIMQNLTIEPVYSTQLDEGQGLLEDELIISRTPEIATSDRESTKRYLYPDGTWTAETPDLEADGTGKLTDEDRLTIANQKLVPVPKFLHRLVRTDAVTLKVYNQAARVFYFAVIWGVLFGLLLGLTPTQPPFWILGYFVIAPFAIFGFPWFSILYASIYTSSWALMKFLWLLFRSGYKRSRNIGLADP